MKAARGEPTRINVGVWLSQEALRRIDERARLLALPRGRYIESVMLADIAEPMTDASMRPHAEGALSPRAALHVLATEGRGVDDPRLIDAVEALAFALDQLDRPSRGPR